MRRTRVAGIILGLALVLGVVVSFKPVLNAFGRGRPVGSRPTSGAGTSTSAVPMWCQAWHIVPSSNPGNIFNDLSGVSATSVNDVWAVGFSDSSGALNTPLVEHWNGSTWTATTAAVVAQHNTALSAVDALASNDVWAVGNSLSGNDVSSTVVEHFNGSLWTIIPSPNVSGLNNNLVAITALSGTDIWAVGSTTNQTTFTTQTLTMHWDGSLWTIVPSPNVGAGNNDLNAVAALSSTDVWAVGSDGVAGSGSLTLHWDGMSWTVVPTPPTSSTLTETLNGVAAFASNDVWAVGLTTSGPSTVSTLALHWNGTSWNVVPTPNPQNYAQLIAVTTVPGTHQLWAIGNQTSGQYPNPGPTTTLVEHWTGSAWVVVPSADTPQPNTDTIHAITALNARDIWAVGYTTPLSGPTTTLIEQDGGLQLGLLCP